MLAGFGFSVQIDRHVLVLASHFLDELAQVQYGRWIQFGPGRHEFLIVNRQDKGAGTALLLGKLAQIAVTRHPHYLKALVLDGLGQRSDAQTRRIFRTVVFVNDDNGKTEFHAHNLQDIYYTNIVSASAYTGKKMQSCQQTGVV